MGLYSYESNKILLEKNGKYISLPMPKTRVSRRNLNMLSMNTSELTTSCNLSNVSSNIRSLKTKYKEKQKLSKKIKKKPLQVTAKIIKKRT